MTRCTLLRDHLRGAEVTDPLPGPVARHLESCAPCAEVWRARRRLHGELASNTSGPEPELAESDWREQWRRIRRRLAPGWVIRCRTCGHGKPLGDVGGIRLGASGAKVTLAWCRHCRGLRLAVIRREEDD